MSGAKGSYSWKLAELNLAERPLPDWNFGLFCWNFVRSALFDSFKSIVRETILLGRSFVLAGEIIGLWWN